jgi:hypothetical protein
MHSFTLRKRSNNTEHPMVTLPTVNSAFLSGLFADVAKVENADPQDISNEDSDPHPNLNLPAKKIGISMTKAMSRCGKSTMTLLDVLVAPRFTLRKRSISTDRGPTVTLATVNSAFLSGLFADVAKVQVEFEDADPQDISNEDSDPRTNSNLPVKKIRVSMSRCGKSTMSLLDVLVSPPPSPDTVKLFAGPPFPTAPSTNLERNDSLLFQLDCISSSSSNESSIAPSTKTILDDTTLDGPHLPASISATTSCNTLTRNLSDLQTFTPGESHEESYGWFVEIDMDEEDEGMPTNATIKPYRYVTSSAVDCISRYQLEDTF